jgi:tripartite-type tricarboxylate transporter receptor subunit TctC
MSSMLTSKNNPGICAAFILTALVLSGGYSSAQAQDWPTRAVKFLLPIGAGSGADFGARVIAEKLSARWGQPVVVENRPGGDGFVALTTFISARDDHTLLYAPTTTFAGHPYFHNKLPYNPSDLAPIARVSSTLVAIGAAPSLGASSLKEAFDKVRAEPGKLNWATTAGATELIINAFLKNAGLEMTRVPYRDAVQAQNDVAEGRLHLYWAAYAIVQAQVRAGRIKVLAVTSSEPSPILPGMPTVTQAGFPDLTLDGLIGLFGTRDMPLALRERIAADVIAVLADATVAQRLTGSGQTVVPGSASEFAAAIEKQRVALAGFAKVLGIKAAATD